MVKQATLTSFLPSSPVVPTSHRLLSFPGIVLNVIQHLDIPSDCRGEYVWPHELLQIALSSKVFLNPALNVLWKSLQGIDALLCTIPSVAVPLEDTQWRAARPLHEKDLERFDFYARKIQVLLYTEISVHPLLTLQLRRLRPNGFCSALRELDLLCASKAFDTALIPAIIPNTIKSIDLHVYGDTPHIPVYPASGGRLPRLLRLLMSVEMRVCNLQSLDFTFSPTMEALETILSLCPRITSLSSQGEARDVAFISAWSVIAKFPNLEELKWRLRRSPTINDLPNDLRAPRLRSLTWWNSNWTAIFHILNTLTTPTLSSLTFEMDNPTDQFGLAPVSYPRPDEHISIDLPGLQELDITVPPFVITSISLKRMLSAVKGLRLSSLRLSGLQWDTALKAQYLSISPISSNIMNITTLRLTGVSGMHRLDIRSLATISQQFPVLETLEIAVLPFINTRWELDDMVSKRLKQRTATTPAHPLRYLGLGSAFREGEEDIYELQSGSKNRPELTLEKMKTAISIAHFIVSLFPKLRDYDVETLHPDADCTFWSAVIEGMRSVRRSRREM